MFATTGNPNVVVQQNYRPMKTPGYSHVVQNQPITRMDYLSRDQQRQIAVSIPNNNNNNKNNNSAPTSRQARYHVPLMTSQTTNSHQTDVDILPFNFSDCQLSSAVFSALHQSELASDDLTSFSQSISQKSYIVPISPCHDVTPEVSTSPYRLQEQVAVPTIKLEPLGQLRLPTIKVTDNMAANVMSEEQDVGYCSFSDISSLQELSDLSDVMNCSEDSDEHFSDIKSNFSDIIDDVLESLDDKCRHMFSEETRSTHNHVEFSSSTLPTEHVYKEQTTVKSEHVSTSQQQQQQQQQHHYVTPALHQPQQYFHHPQMKWYHPSASTSPHMTMTMATQSHTGYPFPTHHMTSQLQCKICHKQFDTKVNLRVHMNQHQRSHQCNYCDKTFTTKSTLKTHIRIHTGERPHVCTFCERAFGDYSTYRKHVRIHTGVKPYACDVCKKTFTQSGNMIRHRTTHFKKRGTKNTQ